MRGLEQEDRYVIEGPYHSLRGPFDDNTVYAAGLRLEREERVSRAMCSQCVGCWHFWPTATGLLALELDTIARRGMP